MKQAQTYLNQSILSLYSRIEQQQQLLHSVQAALPRELGKHAIHCLTTNDKLLIYTDSAVWASQLRFYERAILASLRQTPTTPVNKIQIKVMVTTIGISVAAKHQVIYPSPDKIKLIENLSLTIEDDALQLALRKLSATLKKR